MESKWIFQIPVLVYVLFAYLFPVHEEQHSYCQQYLQQSCLEGWSNKEPTHQSNIVLVSSKHLIMMMSLLIAGEGWTT